MLRHFRLIAVLLLTWALLLSACSAKVPTRKVVPTRTAGDDVPKTAETMTIKVLAGIDQAELNALASAFETANPGYKVERVPVSAAPNLDALRTMLEQGQADVITSSFEGAAAVAKAGLLAPLDPLIQKHRFDLKPLGQDISGMKVDGRFYDLPFGISPTVLLYNVKRFEAQGVPLPSPGWTWEQLRDAARKLADQDLGYWGFAPSLTMYVAFDWAAQKGGVRFLEDEQGVREALKFLYTMAVTDRSMPKSDAAMTFRRDFENGKAAMSLQGIHGYNFMTQNSQGQWDITLPPTLPGGTGQVLAFPLTLAMNAKAKNPDAAWKFISFACGPDGARALAKAGFLPLYNSPEVQKAWGERQPAPSNGTKELMKTTWFIPSRDLVTNDLVLSLQKAVVAATSGEQSWEEAAAQYARELQAYKAQKK